MFFQNHKTINTGIRKSVLFVRFVTANIPKSLSKSINGKKMSFDDSRRNKSWRVENEIKLSPHHHASSGLESKGKLNKKTRNSKQNSTETVDTQHTPILTSNKTNNEISYSDIESATAALWRHNLVGYIDNFSHDLYKHCEELNDDEVCREVARYFQTRIVEFTDLANRVESQRRLEKGESNSAAWSVSTRDMTRSSQSVVSTTPPKRTHTLRASAHEFTPSATTRKLFNPETSSVGSENSKLAAHLAMVAASNTNSFKTETKQNNTSTEHRGRALTESNLHNRKPQASGAGVFPSMGEEPTTSRDTKFPPQSQLDSDGSSSLFTTKRESNATSANSTSKIIKINSSANKASGSNNSQQPQHTKSDSFDLHLTESRVEQARERVWETAEALVDAALVAEEEQWVTLGLSQKQTFRKTFQLDSKLTLDTSSRSTNRTHRSHLSPEDGDDEDFGAVESYRQLGPSSHSVDYNDTHAPLQSPGSVHSASGFHSAMRSSFSLNGSPFYTPNGSYPSSFVSPAPNSASKALHDKLSSPDRKRSHNVDEQKKRNNERHNAANQNREHETEKKRLKGRAVSDKVKDAQLREQEKLSHKGELLQKKQSEADLRRAEQIGFVKSRAGNENSKVEEVIFINTLNSECVADELNKKLAEAEARVLAAEGRRQQRLEDISSQQKTRNSRKVQQISELHMAQEREKMDRFEKLQQKLRDVEERKKERLVEMKRRDEVVVEVVGTAITLVSNANNVAAADAQKNTSTPAVAVEEKKKLTKKDKKHLLAVKNKFSQPVVVPSMVPTPATDFATGQSIVTVDESNGTAKVSKSKAKKTKKRANQTAALSQQASEQDQFNQLLAEVSTLSECVAESVIATTPADITASLQCISDSYQTVQQCIGKKIVLAARTAFVECASVSPSVILPALLKGGTIGTSEKSSDVQLTHMLSAYTSEMSVTTSPRASDSSSNLSLIPSSGKYSTIALQLLAAETPISVNPSHVEQDRLNGGGVHTHSASPGHSPHHSISGVGVSASVNSVAAPEPVVHQERHVKLNISLVLCTVDVADPASVSQFISEGGVLLLRVLLGYEVGVMSSAATFNETLNCSADPALGKSLGLIIFELIASCSNDVVGCVELFACGVPILLADVVSVLFVVQETLCRETAHYQKYSDSLSEYTDDHAQDVRFPYCVSVLLPSAVKTVSVILKLSENTSQCGVQSCDAYVWYLFCSSVFTSLVSSIRSDVQCLQYRHSQDSSLTTTSNTPSNNASSHSSSAVDYKQYHSHEARESIVCSAQLVAAIGLYLRNSGGIYTPISTSSSGTIKPDISHVVKSIVQLSPQTHAHPKGRQLVSLLRRSEVVATLVSLLYSLIVEFHHINANATTSSTSCTSSRSVMKVTRRGNAVNVDANNNTINNTNGNTLTASQYRVFSSVIASLYSIASTDVSLVQQMNNDQQVQLVRSVNFLLRSYVVSLDDGNTVNIFTSTPNCASQGFTKSHAEDSIKQLLMLTALCCLRNPTLQKECNLAANITPLFAPEIIPRPTNAASDSDVKNNNKSILPNSLLVTLCRMSNKFYKDKKFKHCLLPCLLAMTLDVDANITTLRLENKLSTVTKYLEYYIADLNKQQPAQTTPEPTPTLVVEGTEDIAQVKEEKVHSIDPVEILVRISQLFPSDVWSTALVTYTSH